MIQSRYNDFQMIQSQLTGQRYSPAQKLDGCIQRGDKQCNELSHTKPPFTHGEILIIILYYVSRSYCSCSGRWCSIFQCRERLLLASYRDGLGLIILAMVRSTRIMLSLLLSFLSPITILLLVGKATHLMDLIKYLITTKIKVALLQSLLHSTHPWLLITCYRTIVHLLSTLPKNLVLFLLSLLS